MSTKNKIGVYLITGFLGSGKTTLLQNLLNLSSDKRVGVIVNEFGRIGIDGSLVRKKGLELVEINNGSIFCSCLEGSFVDSLIALSRLPISFLFIESSGLSDPSSIDRIFHEIEGITGSVYHFRGTICVADTTNFIELLKTVEAVERQIICSDLVVINKTDLVEDERIATVEKKIAELNPLATIIKTSFGKLDVDLFEQNFKVSNYSTFNQSINCPSNRPETIVLKTGEVLPKESFRSFLDSFSDNTFRIKGFFHLQEGWFHIDGVGSKIVFRPVNIRKSASELVVISKPGESLIERIKESWESRFDSPLLIEK